MRRREATILRALRGRSKVFAMTVSPGTVGEGRGWRRPSAVAIPISRPDAVA